MKPVAWMSQGGDVSRSADYFVEMGFTDLIPLYTQPVKEQYKFGVDWSKDGNAVTVLKICEDGVAEVVFMDYQETTHPVKDLEDIDINITWNENSMRDFGKDELNFARAILKKAQE